MKEKKLIDDTVKRANKTFDKAEELCTRLKDEYSKALEDIQKEVADFYMKYAENNSITYTEAVRALSKAGLNKYRNTLEKFKEVIDINDVGLMAELDAAAAKTKVSRLEGLAASIRLELAKLQAARQDGLEKHLEDTFKLNYEGAVAGIEDIIDIKSSFSMINPS
ncbi:MAG: hypothetical protein N2489_04375, partial [Clostridia bacterium]|nr:hypothetical protein [Clostridia bacterium]